MIGRNVRAVREAQLLSRTDLAERSGVSKAGIDHLERGLSARPRRRTIEKIADALDVPVDELLSEEPIRPKASTPPAQPSFNGLLEEERRGSVADALIDYARRRAEDRDRQARDPDSPYFRTAATAEAWIADLRQEMRTWGGWLSDYAPVLLPPAEDAPRGEHREAVGGFVLRALEGFGRVLLRARERAGTPEGALDDLEVQRILREVEAETDAETDAEADDRIGEATGETA